jgi:hypothetical protein
MSITASVLCGIAALEFYYGRLKDDAMKAGRAGRKIAGNPGENKRG